MAETSSFINLSIHDPEFIGEINDMNLTRGEKNFLIITKKIISDKGGVYLGCFRRDYGKRALRIKVRCDETHIWDTEEYNLRKLNTWCAICSNKKRRLTIADARAFAATKGGFCLSEVMNDVFQLLWWMCFERHTWQDSFKEARRQLWCTECHKKNTRQQYYDEIKAVAESKGGKLLKMDEIYKTKTTTYVTLECKEGHIWDTTANNPLRNRWCMKCFRKEVRLTIEEAKRLAIEKGGCCLSEEYQRNDEKLLWKCAEEHTWRTSLSSIKNFDTWCPKCVSLQRSKGIRKCFALLDEMNITYQAEFRLRDLSRKSYDVMFLYEGIETILEFDGGQHFNYIKHFHKEESVCENNKKVDILKTITAMKNGYKVIRISYKTKGNKIREEMLKALNHPLSIYFSDKDLYKHIHDEIVRQDVSIMIYVNLLKKSYDSNLPR